MKTFIFVGWGNGQFMFRKYSGLSRMWNELLKFPCQHFISNLSRVRFQSTEQSFKFSLLWGQAKCFPSICEERVIFARVHTEFALVLCFGWELCVAGNATFNNSSGFVRKCPFKKNSGLKSIEAEQQQQRSTHTLPTGSQVIFLSV